LIEWSHNLLSEAERVLLRRLSVFAGGWSFEAAQEVCGERLGNDVLDLLTHLIDKSLVTVEPEMDEARYRLPETVRQYARDRLFESGEAERVRDRHLDFFLRFAEIAEPKLRSAEQIEWLGHIETANDNLRTALRWSLESGKSDRALQLAGALYYFWILGGNFSEGYKWVNDALMLSEREQSEKIAIGNYTPTREEIARRAKALYVAGWLQMGALNIENAREHVEESIRLSRELEDKWWTAVALELMGLLQSLSDPQASLAYLEEGISLARQVEDPWPLAVCLIRMGDALKPIGKATEARPFLEEGVALARRIEDKSVLSEGLRELGSLYYLEGDFTTAARLTEEALAEGRAIGSFVHGYLGLFQLVIISCFQSDPVKAKGYCSQLWAVARDLGSSFANAFVILSFGWAACFGEEPGKGVRLLAVTQMLLTQTGLKPSEDEPTSMLMNRALEKVREQLGPEAFQAAWSEGQQMTMEQALALATENEGEDSSDEVRG
jgi:tetratricopeptide (TPR) repeat protein